MPLCKLLIALCFSELISAMEAANSYEDYMTISLKHLFLMPEASFAHCEGYLQSLQLPIFMVRRLVLALMNCHVSCWRTSVDPINCFIFKSHLQHYISVRRFLETLLITFGFFQVDLLRGIAKCTLGSYQF